MRHQIFPHFLLLALIASGCEPSFDNYSVNEALIRDTSPWREYGGVGGTKFADLDQLNKQNVAELEVAWVYRTGDVSTVFQASPIIAEGQLVFCTPFNKVVALDPLTGGELWKFDPVINLDAGAANEFNCRGVASWRGHTDDECSSRIFTATNDARLIALDAQTGKRCGTFGESGEIDLSQGVGKIEWKGEYQVTSPPAVVSDVVVVGSAISDGQRVEAPSGVVRGFDARTGQLVWAFDLAPPDFDYHNRPISEQGYALGTPNVWSAMSVDAERDMVFLPTGNPSPDYDRPNNQDLSYFGSSIVALRGSTGEVLWHFNTVINDLWDFDVPSQPVLADIKINGEVVPSVVQSTKMGFIFLLHRLTGEPLVEVTYREVPRYGPVAKQLSPVQPFPPEAFQTSRSYQPGESLLGLCDGLDEQSVSGPIYTPITEDWTIGLPSNMGATNWGGVAVDPHRGLIVVHTNSVPFRTKLINRREALDLLEVITSNDVPEAQRQEARIEFSTRYDLPDGVELARQVGADYLMARHPYLDPYLGAPCSGIPMGEIMVIDIEAQEQKWRRPHGTVRDIAQLPLNWGAPGVGGPLITSTGLIFIAGAAEKAIRAYDLDTGEELWHHRLPHPGNATPITYSVSNPKGERQFVVIAAGGDARAGIGGVGDYLVGFSLPSDTRLQ